MADGIPSSHTTAIAIDAHARITPTTSGGPGAALVDAGRGETLAAAATAAAVTSSALPPPLRLPAVPPPAGGRCRQRSVPPSPARPGAATAVTSSFCSVRRHL